MMLNANAAPRSSFIRNNSGSMPAPNNENEMSSMRNLKKLNSNNENPFSTSKAKKKLSLKSSTKDNRSTPGPSSRRALGDISNRKPNRAQQNLNNSSIKPAKSNKSVSFFVEDSFRNKDTTPARNDGKIRVGGGLTQFSASKTGSAMKKKTTDFVLPRKSKSLGGIHEEVKSKNIQKQEIRTSLKKEVKQVSEPLSPCDDVEKPAGRMWHEQIEDDEFNCSFELDGCTDLIGISAKFMEEQNRLDSETALKKQMDELAKHDLEALMGGMGDLINIYDGIDLETPDSWGKMKFDDDDISL